MKKLFYFLSLTMMLVSCQQTKESVQPNFSTYDSYLSNEVKEGRLVGVQGMVFQDGKLIYEKSYGLRDRESGDSMMGNESYPAVSPVTIRQALSHTAGMSHGIAPIAYDKEIWNALILNPNIKTLGERVTALSKLPLMWEPGSKWNYSFTPDIVGRLVEVISGKDLSAYLQEKIFDPLGMKETGYNLSEDQQKRVMVVYGFNPDSSLRRMDPQPSMSRNTIYSGVNALFSSAKDYLTFATMLLNRGELNGKRILKPETVDLMSSDHTGGIRYRLDTSSQYVRLGNGIVTDSLGTLNLEPGYQFGLGLAIVQDPAKAKRTAATKGEFFWSGANSTYFFVNPSKKLVGIFMTQVASVGNPNPYGFYFGDQMRASIYKGVE